MPLSKTCRIALLLSVLLASVVLSCVQKKESKPSPADAEPPATPKDSVTIEIVATDSLDVLTLVRSQHDVTAKQSSMGAFVSGIDSTFSGGDCYWLFSINSEMAQTACDQLLVGPGDTVRWHFRCRGE